MNLPGQFSTEALHTTTLLMYIYRREMNPLVNQAQRLAYHYMVYIHIYRRERNPPGQSSTEALHTATLLIYRRQIDPPVN